MQRLALLLAEIGQIFFSLASSVILQERIVDQNDFMLKSIHHFQRGLVLGVFYVLFGTVIATASLMAHLQRTKIACFILGAIGVLMGFKALLDFASSASLLQEARKLEAEGS